MSFRPILPALLLLACPKAPPAPVVPPPELAPRDALVETLHGVEVADPYRWMEDPADPRVAEWSAARSAEYRVATEALPQRAWLYDRFQALMRYDDETVRKDCLVGTRQVWSTRRADQDKWVVHLALGPDDPGRVVLDPNTWAETETLAGFSTSPDCRLVAFGKANAGDENPVLQVMDLDTLKVGPDTFRGWKQGSVSWKRDGSGFFYASKPLADEKPDGGHFYFHRTWWHTVGTTADQDRLVMADDEVKEHWNSVSVSEDGRWAVRSQSLFNVNRAWIEDLQAGSAPVPVDLGMDAQVGVEVLDGKLVIVTDRDAPRRRVMVADPKAPTEWKVLIPESEDTLTGVSAVAGRLFAIYDHAATTRIRMYDLEGKDLGEVPLPGIGSAGVSGWWSRPEVRVSFQSFAHPPTEYRFDPATGQLSLSKASAIPVDPELLAQIGVEQVWVPSKDGTKIPMFVVRRKDAVGPVPTLLTGYGGFDLRQNPRFGTTALVWLEAGGAFALPNLRGGGEFGKAWHEAGMRERKQNVFDDFLASARWLVDQGLTTPGQLAISGGSNGGLLVSAAVTQAPDLFGAVLCSVPLTDMVRFHRFGLANIWTEEYGSADDPSMFPYLYAYSPYHAVKAGTDYPALLVVGSENDARTDPVHARKFYAAARWADVDHGATQPMLLEIQGASGHGGGVTIDTRADQASRQQGFLMSRVGLAVPAAP